MIPASPRPVRCAPLLLLLAACATAGGAPRATSGSRAFQTWLQGDVDGSTRQVAAALKRDPADPWARLAEAELARRALDPVGEARAHAALLAGAPEHPLALVAARRLGDLAETSPSVNEQVEATLRRALEGGALRGLTALRARAARASAAGARGDLERATALRAENGAVVEWTVLGPFGAYHALDLDRPFPPEQGAFPESAEGAPGAGRITARTLPFPDGVVLLEGEPGDADVYYLAADVAVARGGEYLVAVGGSGSHRAWLDGAPLAARRAHEGWPPLAQAIPRTLQPGVHRLLVKLARGGTSGALSVSFSRADGAPSDAVGRPATPGASAPAVRDGALPRAVLGPAELAVALEPEAGPALARLVAALDGAALDREEAKRLLGEAIARAPRSAVLEAARGEVVGGDPTLPERVARERADAAWERVLQLDGDHGPARLALAEAALSTERLDDAAAHLDALGAAARESAPAQLLRARLLAARGVQDAAERAALSAHHRAALCGATAMRLELAARREAIAEEDALTEELARCPGGLRRLADLRRRRGDQAAGVELLARFARTAPADREARTAYAAALAAAGDPAAGARELAELARLWPRDALVEKRRAELLDRAGDPAGARAARQRALALDGGDLQLRRALALEDGVEPLDGLAEDGLAAIAAYRDASPREETSSVVVLDAGAVEVHPDGAVTERIHEVHKVRDESAADRLGELELPPGAQPLRVRTIKRDGRILEPQELAAGEKGSISLPGLEPGDFVETEWLRSTPRRGAATPGLATGPFYLRADVPLWRTRWVVRAPAGFGLEVEALNGARVERATEGAFEVLRAAEDAVAPVPQEPAAAAGTEFLPWVQAGKGQRLEDFARAIGDGFVDRTRPTLELRELAREVAASVPEGERGGEALLRAAWARTAALVLGSGGSIAESASHVLARGRGSRTVLLAGLLRALGVDVRLALVRDFSKDPGPRRFAAGDTHARPLLRVVHGGRTWWLDPSQRLAPFGALPGAATDAEALLVAGPGQEPELARTPPRPEDERREIAMRIALEPDGAARIEGSEVHRGWDAAAAKGALERLDGAARRQALEQTLARSFPDVQLEAVEVEGQDAAEAPLVLRWQARVPAWARVDADRIVADVPLFAERLAAQYAPRATRETPLILSDADDTRLRVEVVAPPGWRAVARERRVDGAAGSYVRVDRADGERLVREDRYLLKRGRIAPEAYAEFAAFAQALDAAQAEPMELERAR